MTITGPPNKPSDKYMEANLTPAQFRLLAAICRRLRWTGRAPTLQELADEFGVCRPTIFEHLTELEAKGCIRRGRGPREITVIGGPAKARMPTRLAMMGEVT